MNIVKPHLDTIEAIAKAATEVSTSARGTIAHFEQTLSPEVALAMVAEMRQLRAGLKEALGGWDARERDAYEDTGGSAYGPFTVDPRSAELRKLVES